MPPKKTVTKVVDDSPLKKGELVEFLGRRASTPKGVAHFSLRTGAPIFPVFIVREHGPYHRIVVEDDISVMRSDDLVQFLGHRKDGMVVGNRQLLPLPFFEP